VALAPAALSYAARFNIPGAGGGVGGAGAAQPQAQMQALHPAQGARRRAEEVRDVEAMIAAAGWRIDEAERMYLPGTPRFAGYNVWGSAQPG
jgi:predicted lipid-binding transport protein (Tim44 family)